MKYFQIETQEGITRIVLSHGRANALDVEFCHAVADAFDGMRESARAVIITGSGNIFSAGVDLKRLCDEGEEYTRQFLPALDRLLLTLFQFPRPLVAAVNGHAIAGGCVLACTADYRLMTEGPYKIGVPELHVGVPFPPSALEVLRFAAPDRYVQELTSGEKIYTPDVAASHGLVHRVVSGTDLPSAARVEAERLASLEPRAFALTKTMLRRPAVERVNNLNAAYSHAVLADWLHPDTRAAIRRYVEANLKR